MSAAAPTDDQPRRVAATDAGLLIVCPKCDRAFGTTRDLSQHRRKAHPTEYHAKNVPTVRQKAPWDHEELLILARAEIALGGLGGEEHQPKVGANHPWQNSRFHQGSSQEYAIPGAAGLFTAGGRWQ